MPTESGDQKLLGNFRKLIDFVSADPNYDLASPALQATALETLYSSGLAATTSIATKSAPYKVAVNNRQTKFGYSDGLAATNKESQETGHPRPQRRR